MRLEHQSGRGRWFPSPYLVDDAVEGHDAVRVQGKEREHGPLFRPAKSKRDSIALSRNRAEERHPHQASVAPGISPRNEFHARNGVLRLSALTRCCSRTQQLVVFEG